MKLLVTFLMILLIFPISAGCAITKEFGPYYGNVIDTETKEPIEGAAVLVVFYTEEYGPAGAITHYADALETVTDKNGEFQFYSHRVTVFRPVQGWVTHGYFTIFKPAYGCYPTHKDAKPMFMPNGTLPVDEHVIIRLPRVKTKEERRGNLCGRNLDAPLNKQKSLIRLLNEERKYLGYESLYQED